MKVEDIFIKIYKSIDQMLQGVNLTGFSTEGSSLLRQNKKYQKELFFGPCDVPAHASPRVKRQAVQKHPHIIEFLFCRTVEIAAIHLFRKCLIADWIWYR